MRIVSFFPAATELLYELGVDEWIVGVTHECNFPQDAIKKPRVISSVIDPEKMTLRQIDDMVSHLAKNNQDIFLINEDDLRKADPDIIIAQATCAVCSPYTNTLDKALKILNKKPKILVINPHTIQDILFSVNTIASQIGKTAQGVQLVEKLQKRIKLIKETPISKKPRVLCIEWVDPFFTSGHWIPEMVEIAGGINLVSSVGGHSRRMSFEEIKEADADIIIMMPCGFDAARTTNECTTILQKNQDWLNLKAVKNKNVFAVDANSYFSKPSIRVITGIEILAKILHPDKHVELKIPSQSFTKIY